MLDPQVLRALQACFQSDSGAFVTPELFKRLLPPLVSQLRAGPPAEVQKALAAYEAPGETAAAEADVYGETAITTLIELAASTSSDELWKPFNHQVCFSCICMLFLKHNPIPQLTPFSLGCGGHCGWPYFEVSCVSCAALFGALCTSNP